MPVTAGLLHAERLPKITAKAIAGMMGLSSADDHDVAEGMRSITAVAFTLGPGLSPCLKVRMISQESPLALENGK